MFSWWLSSTHDKGFNFSPLNFDVTFGVPYWVPDVTFFFSTKSSLAYSSEKPLNYPSPPAYKHETFETLLFFTRPLFSDIRTDGRNGPRHG